MKSATFSVTYNGFFDCYLILHQKYTNQRSAVDTNAEPVKFQDGPIIKYADDAGQFMEAVVLQGVQLVASGLELGPTRLVYTSDGETAGGMGKKKKGARARTAGKDVLAVRNIWQGDDKPEKKELQFLDIYKVNADQSKRLQDKNMTFDNHQTSAPAAHVELCLDPAPTVIFALGLQLAPVLNHLLHVREPVLKAIKPSSEITESVVDQGLTETAFKLVMVARLDPS
eukprot:g79332.t1